MTVKNYLRLLGVGFTTSYLRRRMEVMPFADSMLGLAAILSEYNISNRCVKVADEDLLRIGRPFITIRNGGFMVVQPAENGEVTVTDSSGKSEVISGAAFAEGWSRVVLVGTPSEKSHEPELQEHQHDERVARILRAVAVSASIVLLVAGIVYSPGGGWLRYVIGLLSVVGLYISYLLLQKDLDIPNRVADRICGIIKENSCDEVTQSKGAELFGALHLSEIGAAYFGVNLLVMLYMPGMWDVVFAISLCALPFTLWSVWYQKFRAHAWCALCLCTVGLLWIEGCAVASGWSQWHVSVMEFIVRGGVMVASYAAVAIVVHYLMRTIERSMSLRHCERAYNNIKTLPPVLKSYEMSSPRIEIDPEACSTLIFGNPDARRTFTIMSNPYCWPCAMMHRHVKDWPGEDIKIQCVFISVSADREIINRYFIAAYQQLGAEKAWEFISGWFEGGREKDDRYFDNSGLNINTQEIQSEIERQRRWSETNRFAGTPVVLLNGHELRPPYSIDDYVYMNF